MSAKIGDETDLVLIEIEGKSFEVPRGQLLLACIHYIVRNEVPFLGRFCWSDECGNCELSVTRPGALLEGRVRGCQTVVEDGMCLSGLTPDLRYWLHSKLSR